MPHPTSLSSSYCHIGRINTIRYIIEIAVLYYIFFGKMDQWTNERETSKRCHMMHSGMYRKRRHTQWSCSLPQPKNSSLYPIIKMMSCQHTSIILLSQQEQLLISPLSHGSLCMSSIIITHHTINTPLLTPNRNQLHIFVSIISYTMMPYPHMQNHIS
jgi:hypothetical protein